MNDGQFEQELTRLFSQGCAANTESFRDALLVRCLDVLGANAESDDVELDDGMLEMLAAAGDLTARGSTPFANETPGR